MIEKAISLATDAHYGQLDKSNVPYIFHPLRVMEKVRSAGYDERYQIVAVLHDVIEDTDVSLETIRIRALDGMNSHDSIAIMFGIMAMTRLDHETYNEYVERLMTNEIATIVKQFDVKDNLGRMAGLPESEVKGMTKRYLGTLNKLSQKDWERTLDILGEQGL